VLRIVIRTLICPPTHRSEPVLSLNTTAPYDWPDGETEDGGLVDASRPGYRQVAAGLRDDILAGRLAGTLKPQSVLAGEHRVSVAIINAAVTELAREGLVNVEHGKLTTVAARRRWLVRAEAEVEADYSKTLREARGALETAVQPPASGGSVTLGGDLLVFSVTVESAHVDGALVVALSIAHRVFGVLPVTSVSAQEASA
jgi:DNA-binding transcriptional regulator YhcF (GntR family)